MQPASPPARPNAPDELSPRLCCCLHKTLNLTFPTRLELARLVPPSFKLHACNRSREVVRKKKVFLLYLLLFLLSSTGQRERTGSVYTKVCRSGRPFPLGEQSSSSYRCSSSNLNCRSQVEARRKGKQKIQSKIPLSSSSWEFLPIASRKENQKKTEGQQGFSLFDRSLEPFPYFSNEQKSVTRIC